MGGPLSEAADPHRELLEQVEEGGTDDPQGERRDETGFLSARDLESGEHAECEARSDDGEAVEACSGECEHESQDADRNCRVEDVVGDIESNAAREVEFHAVVPADGAAGRGGWG